MAPRSVPLCFYVTRSDDGRKRSELQISVRPLGHSGPSHLVASYTGDAELGWYHDTFSVETSNAWDFHAYAKTAGRVMQALLDGEGAARDPASMVKALESLRIPRGYWDDCQSKYVTLDKLTPDGFGNWTDADGYGEVFCETEETARDLVAKALAASDEHKRLEKFILGGRQVRLHSRAKAKDIKPLDELLRSPKEQTAG